MAAPKGNQYGKGVKSPRPFADMIKLVLGDKRRMRNLAEQLVKQAEQGNMQAMACVLDRTDGKAIAVSEHTHDGELTIKWKE